MIRGRVGSLAIALLALLACSVPATGSTAQAAPPPAPSAATVVARSVPASSAMRTAVVTLRGHANLSAIRGRSRGDRLRAVVSALRTHARESQAPLRSRLRTWEAKGEARGVRSLWISHSIVVTATPRVLHAIAARSDVANVADDHIVLVPALAPATVNQQAISAPSVWDLGHTGQGAVVASLDSGVDASHPDLAGRWRGGTNSWFDPYGQHPSTPTDFTGHGTATVGVMVGGDSSGSTIGTAPGASWIAARVFDDSGTSTISAVHQAFQWVLDPDHDPGTADAPQVVNASWSIGAGPGCDLTFQPDVQALRAANILTVTAAGNFGPTSSSSVSPANYPESISVGAVSDTGLISSSSSRGPSACAGRARPFPDVVAPGVDILTTDRWGLFQYASGTSMAAPHAAGVLALLLGARPGLTADEQQQLLLSTAQDLGTVGPDETYGSGRIDAASAHAALPPPAPSFDLAAAPASTTVEAGSTVSLTVQVSPVNGFTGDVALSLSGLPAAEGTASFSPSVITGGSGQATLTVTATADAAAGSFPLTVTGTSGTLTRTAGLTLDITLRPPPPSFDLAVTPASATVVAGGTVSYAVQVSSVNGFTGDVALSLSGLPAAEGTASFSPSIVTGGSGQATLSIATPGGAAAGTFPLTVSGTTGTLTLNAAMTLAITAPPPPDALFFSTAGRTNPPGVMGTADDADVYGWGGSAFSRVFDASVAGLPLAANVDGFDRVDATHFYLSFATDTAVPGLGTVQDEDVVFYNAGTWSVWFDGTAHGLTGSAGDLDAISVSGSSLYFSTTGNVNPPGVAGTSDDADLYSWNGTSYARVWDATVNGFGLAANVDGVVRVDAAHLYLSFSPATTTVPTLGSVQDEDVVYGNAGTWSVYFDGTAHGLGTSSDLDVDAFDLP